MVMKSVRKLTQTIPTHVVFSSDLHHTPYHILHRNGRISNKVVTHKPFS